jgi:integrase
VSGKELATGSVFEYKDRGSDEQVVDPKKGKKWMIVINLPKLIDVTQKRPRKYHTFYGSRTKAEREKNKLVYKYNEKIKRSIVTGNIVVKNTDMTFGEYAELWILKAKYRMKKNTWKEYARVLRRHIIPAMGHRPLRDISAFDISQYAVIKLSGGRLDGKKGGLDQVTVNKHLSYISVVLESATEPENGLLIPFNPASLVKRNKNKISQKEETINSNNAAIVNCYSVQELNLLLSKLEKLYSFRRLPKEEKMKQENINVLKNLGFTKKEIESPMALFKIKVTILYPFIYLAARTGMRRSELLALKWSNIDFNQMIIKVYSSLHHGKKEEGEENAYFYNTTKEGKPKSYIKITEKDVKFLKHLRKEQVKERRRFEKKNKEKRKYHDLNLVFCQNNGVPLWGESIGKALKDFIESNGLKPITIHGLRHTHCTLLLLAGVDDAYVALRVGHRDSTTTRRIYFHVDRGNIPDLGNIFEKILEGDKIFTKEEAENADKRANILLDAIGG